MERKDVLNLARHVYGAQDRRVEELTNMFATAADDIINLLARFVADKTNWNAKAPRADVQKLMNDIAQLAVQASVNDRPFVDQTFRDERIQTNGDLAKLQTNVIIVKLALNQADTLRYDIHRTDQLAQDVAANNGKLPKSNDTGGHYTRERSAVAIDKVVQQHAAENGWQGGSADARVHKEKAALMRKLDDRVDTILKNGQKPQDFADEIKNDLSASKSRAERILRTETAGQMSRNLVQDFSSRGVKKYMIESALTATTCQECKDLDGKIYSIDEAEEGVTLPPFHPNCKCTIIEVHDEEFHTDFSQMPSDYGGALFDTSNM